MLEERRGTRIKPRRTLRRKDKERTPPKRIHFGELKSNPFHPLRLTY